MTLRLRARFAGALALGVSVSCASRPPERVIGVPTGALVATATATQDTTPKAELRMVPPEAYLRTYLLMFGDLAPIDAQKKARGGDGNALFDSWNDYVSALGFPDYGLDIPRQTQTNALMVATFERLGIALCDRAVEHDLPMLGRGAKPEAKPAPATRPEAKPAPAGPVVYPIAQRVVFAFEPPSGPMTDAAFAERFDVLHRTFLGYPASLATRERTARFHALYTDIAAHHLAESPKSRFTPDQAAWAAVCYGLVRHPEFHLY